MKILCTPKKNPDSALEKSGLPGLISNNFQLIKSYCLFRIRAYNRIFSAKISVR